MGKQSRAKSGRSVPSSASGTSTSTSPTSRPSKDRTSSKPRPQPTARAAGPRGRATSAWTTFALFVGVLVVYAFTVDHGAYSLNDAQAADLPAWALAKGQTLALDSIEALRSGAATWTFTVNGSIRSDRFPGPVLSSYPFYLLGPSDFSVIPGALMGAVTTAGAVAFMHRALLRVVAPVTAMVAVLLFAFGTGAWTTAAATALTHGPALLGLAIGTWALSHERYVIAGLGYGYALLSRPHLAVVAAVTGVWASIRQRSAIPALKVAGGAMVGIVVLLVYSKINADTWNFMQGSYQGRPSGAVAVSDGGGFAYLAGKLPGALFAPKRGLLVLSPFLLFLIPGLVSAWRTAPTWVRSSTVGGLAYLAIQLFGNTWSGGAGFFGYRLVLEPLLLAAPLLAMSGESWVLASRRRVQLFLAVAALSVWWFALAGFFWEIPATLDYTWSTFDVPNAISQAGIGGVVLATVFTGIVLFAMVWIARMPGARPDGPTAMPQRGVA